MALPKSTLVLYALVAEVRNQRHQTQVQMQALPKPLQVALLFSHSAKSYNNLDETNTKQRSWQQVRHLKIGYDPFLSPLCNSTHCRSLIMHECENLLKRVEQKWFLALRLSFFGPCVFAEVGSHFFLLKNIMRMTDIWVKTRGATWQTFYTCTFMSQRKSRVPSIRFLFLC